MSFCDKFSSVKLGSKLYSGLRCIGQRIKFFICFRRTWELLAPWTGAKIKVPAKLITGDQDCGYCFLGFKEYIESGEFKKDVPSLQEVVVMEGVGHFINQVKPEEISAHIYEFINKF